MEAHSGSYTKLQTEPVISKKITNDTTIGDVLMQNPKHAALLSEIMTGFGIHCVGCGAATYETLEQGVLGHGFSEEQLTKLVKDLNRVVEENPIKPSQPIQEFKLTLTNKALSKVREAVKQRGKQNSTLRVSVIAGGCSGFMYDLEFVDSPNNSDLNFKQENVNIAVNKEGMDMLNGMEIDYIDTLNESGFKFNNPNASHGCGCGKSFA